MLHEKWTKAQGISVQDKTHTYCFVVGI